jgi:thiol-disulfide isomerase/thioredoxin
MDFFFKSTGCPACDYLYSQLQRSQEKWTGSLKIVEVEFDSKTDKLMTYIDGKESGESPVGSVPAYYTATTDTLVTGLDAVQKELSNASWNI